MTDEIPRPDAPATASATGPTAASPGADVSEPPTSAAGLRAVEKAMRVVVRQSGLRRGIHALRRVNQTEGFDCPSCAWADPDGDRSFAEFCENGAKAVADAADRHRLDAPTLGRFTLTELAAMHDRDLNALGRITEPMIRRSGTDRFVPATWDDALGTVAAALRSIDDPDRAIFYTSGRASNEAAFLYQLFVRAFGTNNLPDCSNLCHESSGRALGSTIGIGKGTVRLSDFDEAELIIVIGQNPGTNHPRMLSALQTAKSNGASIVSINPLREAGLVEFRNPQDFARPRGLARAVTGTPMADTHLRVRIGGDLALLTGVQKALVERDRGGRGGIDHEWLDANAVGFDSVAELVSRTAWSDIETESGIERHRLRELADMIGDSRRIIWCWAMGLTQHEHAVGTLQQIVNLALMRGAIGIPGAGLCPVRGHSNVQGDRTVGVWERPTDEFIDRLESAVGFTAPRVPGHDVVHGIQAMHRGEMDVFVSLGGNLLSAGPDTAYTAEALGRVRVAAHIVTKLNRSHLVEGGTMVLLPCLARTDLDVQASGPQFVTCENSMGVVQRSAGDLEPPSSSVRSEPAIVAKLAALTLGDTEPVDWSGLAGDYDRIRDLIEAAVAGFDDYNRRVRQPGGFELPNPPRFGDFSGLTGGRAVLTAYPLAIAETGPGELVMTTIRSHDQFNTTIYAHDDRYRGIAAERRVVLMSPDDIAHRGLVPGQRVDLVGRHGGVERRAENFLVVSYDIPVGNCATYFPEANVLVPVDRVALGSNTPMSKYVPVTVEAVSNV